MVEVLVLNIEPHLVFVAGTKVAMFAQCRLSLLGGLASSEKHAACLPLMLTVSCIVPESHSSCNNI